MEDAMRVCRVNIVGRAKDEPAHDSILISLGSDDRELTAFEFADGFGAFPVGLLRMMQITSTADGAILRRLRRDARITVARERRVGRVNGSVIGAFTLQHGLDAAVAILTIWTYTHFTSSRTRSWKGDAN